MNAQRSGLRIRLNPFLFPSETDLRFVLLMVILLAESLFTYSYIHGTLFLEAQSAQTLECNQASGYFGLAQDFKWQMLSPFNYQQGGEWVNKSDISRRMFEDCMWSWDLSRAFWGLGGCVLLALVTLGIYWFAPIQKIRRENYTSIPTEDAGEVLDYLKAICAEIAISPLPTFLWNPLDRAVSGLAFGRFGKYYVALTGGLVTQFYTDKEAFRAIVFHELAHLHNKDIDKTYLTVAAWQAFIFVVLIPQFLAVFPDPIRQLLGGLKNIDRFFSSLFYALVFAVDAIILYILVYLTRNALLRTRELYADVRASVWDGPNGSLRQVLQAMPDAKHKTPELLRNHPDPQKRVNLLTNTTSLFTIGALDAFMVGIAAMVGVDEFRTLLVLLMPFYGNEQLVAGLVTGLLYAVILVGILGTLVWRLMFLSRMTGQRQGNLVWWKIGMSLGMGSALGASISFANAVNVLYGALNIVLVLVFNIFLGIFLGVALSLFLSWVAGNANVWLSVAPTSTQMRRFFVAFSIASAITMTCWLGWMFAAWSPGSAALTLFGLVAGVPLALANPFTILFFALLWLCPLSVYFWSRKAVEFDRAWAFLDAAAQMTKTAGIQTSFKKVFLVGGVIGILYCLSDLVITLLLRFVVPASTRASDDYKILSFIIYIIMAVLAQGLMAAIITAWSKHLKVYYGLLAAFFGGCIIAIGFSVNNLLFGGGIIPIVFPWMLNSGALLAMPVALIVNLILLTVEGER